MEPKSCPYCFANLVGKEIPKEQRYLFGHKLYFLRVIGIEENDRVVRWKCPDCQQEWPRRD